MIDVFILDMQKNWFISIFRSLFAFLDFIVYSVISVLFRTIFNLANFELVGFYESFEQRVYVVLGIFMLFKVTVSVISYLVNPDKISDKEQGVGKIITRILMVLIMLIALPTFFSLMTEFQNKLLPVIPRVVVGTANTLSSEDVTGVAENMSLTMIQSFAHLKDGCTGDELSSPSDFLTNINNSCSDGDKTIYAYDYLPIISTLVGFLACYVLFSLCITVAIRAFKMIILRMIAPIPIISYVDPKSSKNGAFSTWTKTLITTWAELFILIGIIYFIVYIIDFVLSGDAWVGFFSNVSNPVDGALCLAFLFIGLLFFAKQAPKFLFDALGIKNNGSFTRMLGMGAAALGMGGSVASSLRARNAYDRENNDGNVRHVRNVGASLLSGLASGANAGSALLSTDKPTLTTGYDAQAKSNATMLSRINAGSTLGGRLGAMGQSLLYGQTDIDRMEIKWKEEEEKIKYDKQRNAERKTIMDRASSKGLESLETSTDINKTYNGRSYQLNGMNAATFNSWAEGVLAGNGVLNDIVYTDQSGAVISASDYSDLASKRDKLATSIKSYNKKIIDTYYDSSGNVITDKNTIWQIKNDKTYAYMNGISYEETVQYTNENGTVISESDYNSMVNSYNDAVEAYDKVTVTQGESYAMYNGKKVYVDDIKLIQHDVNDGNIADYAEQALAGTIDDSVISGADQRFASANDGVGVERVFGGANGIKAKYGSTNNDISQREMEIANEKNSPEVRKMQANKPSGGSRN